MNPTTLNKETAKNIYMFQKKKNFVDKVWPTNLAN